MTNKKKINKIVLKTIKSQLNDEKHSQLEWQKTVIREDYINNK